jgi:hypothetical protein
MIENKVVAEGKFEGSKAYLRRAYLENKKGENKNYFLKLCKRIKRKSEK